MGSCGNGMKLEALPKGFRFRPTDEELVNHYLRLKINGHHSAVEVIPEIDVCKWEPWDLPALSVIKSDDPEWFFFCPRDKKYPNGYRSNRATEAGYWKATGKDRTIKSRKPSSSGHSHTHVIGLKKTLVFYRGRAPKGERTNWIMHEYRATEPDLDGTGSGQGDYVLCRLFHKADERLENLKCNEAEHTVSVPSTDKSSPDDVSSDVLREPVMLDIMAKEPGDGKNWLTDQADSLTPANVAPRESCVSDGIDQSGEETAMEVYLPRRDNSMSQEATYNQFDDKVTGAFQSHSYADLEAFIGSPFAADFGYERNGSHFQDGTSEQDASLSDLLEGLQNHGNCCYEESTGHTTYNPCGSFIPSHVDDPTQAPFTICKDQTYSSLSQVPCTDLSRSHHAVEEIDSSVNTVEESFHRPIQTFCYHNPMKDDIPDSETGIKIRSRQPRNPPSRMNFTSQGTASRRMRLWFGPRPESNYCNRFKEDESQSLSTQASKETDNAPSQEAKLLNQNADIAHKSDPRPTVKHGQLNSLRMPSFPLSACGGSGLMKVYAVGLYATIMVSVLLGIWICPKLNAQHG